MQEYCPKANIKICVKMKEECKNAKVFCSIFQIRVSYLVRMATLPPLTIVVLLPSLAEEREIKYNTAVVCSVVLNSSMC